MDVLTATDRQSFGIALGGDAGHVFNPNVPVLGGEPMERLFPVARFLEKRGRFSVFQEGTWRLGAAKIPVVDGLETGTRQLYRDLFASTGAFHLARIWNYVPAINAVGATGLENYRAFSRGRSLAFEERYGTDFKAYIPSASAVGCQSGELTVVFAAGRSKPRHVENPLQVPAYEYPTEYGPRPPSFARATIAGEPDHPAVFISGTSAIQGHATVAPNDTDRQLAVTLDNLQAISRACGLSERFSARGKALARYFKVYLRHAADQPAVAASLEERLLEPGDTVSYLHADICRAPLNVEIDVTLLG